MTETFRRTIGDSGTIVDRNNIPELLSGMKTILAGAAEVGSKRMKEIAKEIEATDGDGTWPEKSEAQRAHVERRGGPEPDKLMHGVTKSLADSIEEVDTWRSQGFLRKQVATFVGWGDDIHPDPGVFGDDRQAPRLTKGQIALVHETGLGQGQVHPNIPASSGDGSEFNIPERRWLSRINDAHADKVFDPVEDTLIASIATFGMPVRP